MEQADDASENVPQQESVPHQEEEDKEKKKAAPAARKVGNAGGGQAALAHLKRDITIDPSKPMPQFDNGESHAYAASDNRDKNRHYVALIADHGQLPRWQSADAYENLADTSLLRLIDHGVVYWSPAGKQQYAFVYNAAIGDCIMPEGGESQLNWRQTEISDYLIAPMTRILKTMTDRNFAHGSIRPSNIFFSGRDKNKPVVLGDCLSVYPHSAQPELFMSVERASAEPFGRGSGTVADDIYAFGVSLALILRKSDELEGLSDKEILQRKIELGSYAAIVGAERLQTRYIELLRGMLHDDSSQRWIVDDIFSWLDGSRMTPPALPRRKKANRPFVFRGRKYLFPDTLVLDMAEHMSDTLKAVESGELSQWIEKAFNDKDLNESYVRAMERLSGMPAGKDNADFTLMQVILALNPVLPIYFKGRIFTYDGVGGLMARTCYERGELSVFKDVLQQNILDQAASVKTIPQNEILSVIKSFDVCRTILRQKKRGSSVEKCIYHLCRSAPCFSPKFENYFVHDSGSCLRSFEDMSSKGGQIAIYMDQHSTAFFSVHETRLIDRVMYDLNQSEKNNQIAGNLRFLAMLQKKAKIPSLPAISKVFEGSLAGVYNVYSNIKLREQIIEGVRQEAEKGNLIGMSALIDNHVARQRDSKAFELAKREYKYLQYEYDQYNRRLAHKNTYGVVNGQETASLISWSIATIITVLSVIAYISGYRIF